MRRTTAGINFFRVSARKNGGRKKCDDADDSSGAKSPRTDGSESWEEDMEWAPETEEPRAASSTLNEIIADNSVLRTQNVIKEKVFDIELDEHLCEMRKDTKLIMVDIPGVNEAGSSKMYMDYVSKNWATFDCVVVVMDVMQGVNTEEQVSLLQSVKDKLAAEKKIPIIVLCNKVDDPEDEEVALLVDEVRAKVEQIFSVDCREAALNQILATTEDGRAGHGQKWPAFIPISAGNAFLYRMASRLSLADFKKLDKDSVDKIGRAEIGRIKWKKLSQQRKHEIAFAAVSDQSEYEERLEATNFNKFLDVLVHCIGGEAAQAQMIEKQLEVAVKNLSYKDCLAKQLLGICERSKVVGQKTVHLKDRFWTLYIKQEDDARSSFSVDMELTRLHDCMEQLIRYAVDLNKTIHDDGKDQGWKQEEMRATKAMETLVHYQYGMLQKKYSTWNVSNSSMMLRGVLSWDEDREYFYHHGRAYSPRNIHQDVPSVLTMKHPSLWKQLPSTKPKTKKLIKKRGNRTTNRWENRVTNEIVVADANPGLVREKATWTNLSPCDWIAMVDSISILAYDKHFCEYFGRKKHQLEMLKLSVFSKHMQDGSTTNNYLAGTHDDNGVFTPNDPFKYALVKQIDIRESPSDPLHWGHLTWKFCQFQKSREASK